MTGRDFDFLTARHAWASQAWIRSIRDDRDASQSLFELYTSISESDAIKTDFNLKAFSDIMMRMLDAAEAFEGLFWRKGHLCAGDYSPAMAGTNLLYHAIHKDRKDTLLIEVFAAAIHLAIAQSFDASLYDGMSRTAMPLDFVVPLFHSSTQEVIGGETGRHIGMVLTGLNLDFNETIPPDEYLDIFDSANTRRIRELVEKIMGPDRKATEMEMRERVQTYNQHVRSFRKRALESADVSIAGGIAKEGAKVFGLELFAQFIAPEALRQASTRIGRQLDRRIGDRLDQLRGVLNGVSAESTRLYRIRRRLERSKARTPTG